MHNGKIISLDTPERVKNSVGKKSLEIIPADIKTSYRILKNLNEFEVQIFGDRLNIISETPEETLRKISNILLSNKIDLLSYRITDLSLENVFIHLINK
jgi:ABC-2 type transport system ATP-binding protein